MRQQPTSRLNATTRIPILGLALCGLAAACALPGCTGGSYPGASAPAVSCLPGERGFLRASLRGAIDAEVDWRGAVLQCEGGARPDGRGLRVSFLGPVDAHGRQLRLVFGIAARPGAGRVRDAATNVTVIIEGKRRLYATQGDGKCAIESLMQEPLPVASTPAPGAPRAFRVAARGYCIDPATALDGTERLYINRFDFGGVARFDDSELHGTIRQD